MPQLGSKKKASLCQTVLCRRPALLKEGYEKRALYRIRAENYYPYCRFHSPEYSAERFKTSEAKKTADRAAPLKSGDKLAFFKSRMQDELSNSNNFFDRVKFWTDEEPYGWVLRKAWDDKIKLHYLKKHRTKLGLVDVQNFAACGAHIGSERMPREKGMTLEFCAQCLRIMGNAR